MKNHTKWSGSAIGREILYEKSYKMVGISDRQEVFV